MAIRKKKKIVIKCKSIKRIERPSCPQSLCSVTAVVIGNRCKALNPTI